MREVDLPAFAAAYADGAFVIDVREPALYVTGYVPGSRLVPMARLPLHLGELPRHQRVYLICATGGRSLARPTIWPVPGLAPHRWPVAPAADNAGANR